MAQLREVSPQALNRLEQLDLKLWANYIALCLQGYGHNTPNIVEVMSNWIPQERRYSILDLLRALAPDVWTTDITLYWQHNSMTELLLLPSIRPNCYRSHNVSQNTVQSVFQTKAMGPFTHS